jgi:hypothetical protein
LTFVLNIELLDDLDMNVRGRSVLLDDEDDAIGCGRSG